MQFRMASLLMHSEAVPINARAALKAAQFGPPEYRCAALNSAARVLHSEMNLPDRDVRELLDLHECVAV